jgi:hypothetical protein
MSKGIGGLSPSMSELTITESPSESLTLTPKHIPSAGQLLELRARGLGIVQIAEQINQSVRTTKELLTQAQRSATLRAAKDILIRDLIPKIVDNIAAGLDREHANKRDLDVATFSLNLADRIGLTDLKDAGSGATTKVETYEEFMFRRTVKHESTEPAPSGSVTEPVVVTATRVDLQDGNAPDDASIDAEILSASSDEGPAADEPS